jgi:hypothetical protein
MANAEKSAGHIRSAYSKIEGARLGTIAFINTELDIIYGLLQLAANYQALGKGAKAWNLRDIAEQRLETTRTYTCQRNLTELQKGRLLERIKSIKGSLGK